MRTGGNRKKAGHCIGGQERTRPCTGVHLQNRESSAATVESKSPRGESGDPLHLRDSSLIIMNIIPYKEMIALDVVSLSDILFDIESIIPQLMETYGILVYAIVFAVIFCETGLVFAPFLPGDSLLFLLGFFAAGGGLNVWVLLVLIAIAAIGGDSLNYWIGHYFGDRLIHGKRCLVDRRHVEVTRQYFRKYGKKTIILARFVPYIRSFAPFIAGIVKMDYPSFLSNNVVGGLLWVTGFISLGYLVASLPFFSKNQEMFLWAILAISIGICLLMLYNFAKTVKECEIAPESLIEDISRELGKE